MITKYEKIVAQLNGVDRQTAIQLLHVYVAGIIPKLIDYGFESVTANDGDLMTSDGREIVWSDGAAWALIPTAHYERRQVAIEHAITREVVRRKSQQEVCETIAATTCPQMIGGKPCGGALNKNGVCPACITGKMGYKYRYTCESCGCDIVTREELR